MVRLLVGHRNAAIQQSKKNRLYAEFDLSQNSSRHVQPPRDQVHEAFLHQLTKEHDVAGTEFLVEAGGYLTTLAPQE